MLTKADVPTGCSRQWKEWPAHHESNLAGLIAMVIGLVIAGTSIHQVRSRFFNFFFGTHQLYILFLIFTMLHIGEEFFYMIMAGVLLFTIDRFLRFIQSRKAAGLISVRSLPGDTTELVFAKHPSTYWSTLSLLLRMSVDWSNGLLVPNDQLALCIYMHARNGTVTVVCTHSSLILS